MTSSKRKKILESEHSHVLKGEKNLQKVLFEDKLYYYTPVAHIFVDKEGNAYSNKRKTMHKLKPSTVDGYQLISIYDKDTKERRSYYIHRLMCETFLINKDTDFFNSVNHINEKKDDNSIENLEWCSVRYNINFGERNNKVAKALHDTSSKGLPYYIKMVNCENEKEISAWPSIKCCATYLASLQQLDEKALKSIRTKISYALSPKFPTNKTSGYYFTRIDYNEYFNRVIKNNTDEVNNFINCYEKLHGLPTRGFFAKLDNDRTIMTVYTNVDEIEQELRLFNFSFNPVMFSHALHRGNKYCGNYWSVINNKERLKWKYGMDF